MNEYEYPANAVAELANVSATDTGPQPQANPPLTNIMMSCPKSWAGDTGFLEWVTNLYNQALTSVPQTSPPTLTKITPTHVKANTNPTVTLTGTGFDVATVKAQIAATQLTAISPTTTSFSVAITPALIATPGSVVQVSVVQFSGVISNAVNLYLD